MKNTVRRAVSGLATLAAAGLLSGCYLVGVNPATGEGWGLHTDDSENHGNEEITALTAVSSGGRLCRGTVTILGENAEESGNNEGVNEKQQLVVLACTNEPLTSDGDMRGVEIGLGRIKDTRLVQDDGTETDGYVVRITWVGSPQDGLNYNRMEEIRLTIEYEEEGALAQEIDRAIAQYPRK